VFLNPLYHKILITIYKMLWLFYFPVIVSVALCFRFLFVSTETGVHTWCIKLEQDVHIVCLHCYASMVASYVMNAAIYHSCSFRLECWRWLWVILGVVQCNFPLKFIIRYNLYHLAQTSPGWIYQPVFFTRLVSPHEIMVQFPAILISFTVECSLTMGSLLLCD